MQPLQRVCATAAALIAIFGAIASAPAQPYPSRPITIVVPYSAGGLFDALARVLAEPMRAALGQSVVIENVGGAGGSIAVGRVARAAPDGYTLSIGSGDQFVVNPAIYPLQYDVVNRPPARSPWWAAASCAPTPSPAPAAWPPRRTSRRWTRRDFRSCTFQSGAGCSCRKGRPKA